MTPEEEYSFVAGWYCVVNPKLTNHKVEPEVKSYLLSEKRYNDEENVHLTYQRTRDVWQISKDDAQLIPITSKMLICLN